MPLISIANSLNRRTPVFFKNTGVYYFNATRGVYSTVTKCSGSTKVNDSSDRIFLTLSLDYYSATLWQPPYSSYQQFLFDTIDQMHHDGKSYIKISQWMSDNGHLTPRGSVFKPNHAWSIHKKKRKSIERFSRSFEPEITAINIDITKT